jgi:hypothetical protein
MSTRHNYRRKYKRKKNHGSQNDQIFFRAIGLLIVGVLLDQLSRVFGIFSTPFFVVGGTAVILVIGMSIAAKFFLRTWRREQKMKPYYHTDLQGMFTMDPFEFEKFAGRVFESQGYSVHVTRARADNGIDIAMEKEGKKYVVQVKKKFKRIGESEVRDFYGSFAEQGYEKGFL